MTERSTAAPEVAKSPSDATHFFAIVVGTGFAGAVTACRLVEAGFNICVLERGRRYGPQDFPKYPTEDLFGHADKEKQNFAPPPDFSRWLWSKDHGIYDIRDLEDTMSVQAAGYGGGSLIYANVHLRPPSQVFEQGWPEEYKHGKLEPYFDLAAYMLQASPIPTRIAKTIQLKKAADRLDESADRHWFRTPLAVNFTKEGKNHFGRGQNTCDMRGRCWRGCDHQAKNTLDMNYLARAEDGAKDSHGRDIKPDIRTLAEVTKIERHNDGFSVTYRDLIFRGEDESQAKEQDAYSHVVYASHVFLCAGSLNTTELLLNSPHLWDEKGRAEMAGRLGSHYFPNSDSLSVVFDCDEPHEADYGPTITSALLYQKAAKDDLSQSLDFEDGRLAHCNAKPPAAGTRITGPKVNGKSASATLVHDPVLDWGRWEDGAVGTLVLDNIHGEFSKGELIEIGTQATAIVRSAITPHEHWFLVEDGGYPPDLEPLVGVFRSPLWLRRNRYLEHDKQKPLAPLRRPRKRLQIQAFADALGGTARGPAASQGVLARSFEPTLNGVLGEPVKSILPRWFTAALDEDRKELVEQAAALALPLLGRLLADLSKRLVTQIDPETLARLGQNKLDGSQAEVLARGILRQGLQILAGSEAAVAAKAANLFLDAIPETPGDLLAALGDLLLWALAYDTNDGHVAVLLTMGRDLYRGRLDVVLEPGRDRGRLKASVPTRLLDTSSGVQERVLRDIASRGWNGELRTNPAWTTLGKRVTVHSQGGCPMGEPLKSVTRLDGQLHGCPELYVMDAAAFPTSVGVNPSATIAAVAEFKIETFIRRATKNDEWKARDKDDAKDWVDRQGRPELDPLNHAGPRPSNASTAGVLGLCFNEELKGFLADVGAPGLLGDAKIPAGTDALESASQHVPRFRKAEELGVQHGREITANLEAAVTDLARLISPERTVLPLKIALAGTITLEQPGEPNRTLDLDKRHSFLQLFLRSSDDTRPVRFFRYELPYVDRDSLAPGVIHGFKVLRNAPGMDFWLDTSTLFFEMFEGGRLKRGVMRISVESFLLSQLPNMDITGTTDPARKSWALAAFYKYYVRELAVIYMKQADQAADLLFELLTGIHV